jgi:translation initiation factor 2 alpha subunit (eIF-2alpha)
VTAKVISLIPEERKIGLSLKRLSSEENDPEYAKYLESQRAESSTKLGDVFASKFAGLKVNE